MPATTPYVDNLSSISNPAIFGRPNPNDVNVSNKSTYRLSSPKVNGLYIFICDSATIEMQSILIFFRMYIYIYIYNGIGAKNRGPGLES